MSAEASIQSLRDAGLDFPRLETEGIDPFVFGSLLVSSGLVCDEDVHWISFHGGYDFGYLTKLLLLLPLPDDEFEFDKFMKKFFPSIYDVKYLMKYATKQHGMGLLTPLDPSTVEVFTKFEQKQGLDGLADAFKIKRQGLAHTAGSDALLTGKIFFRMRERIFNGEINDEHKCKVWGLGYPDGGATFANILSTPQHYHNHENVTPGQNGYANGTPSTPNTGSAGLASTPGHNSNGGGMAPMTPGAAGGAFGSFQYNSK